MVNQGNNLNHVPFSSSSHGYLLHLWQPCVLTRMLLRLEDISCEFITSRFSSDYLENAQMF